MMNRFFIFAALLATWPCAGVLRAAESGVLPSNHAITSPDNQYTRSGWGFGGKGLSNLGTTSLDNQYQLGPGDQVLYQVIEDQDGPTNLTVTDSGDLEVPYYGLVHAAGKTCHQLADEIKSRLEKKLYYRATVVMALQVANKAWIAGKVYVTGQVRQPGGFDLKPAENLTVSKAILDAGGFSDFSDKKHVRLVRKTAHGDRTFVVNVVDVWNGHLDQDLPVQPGDVIVVPPRLVNY